jgi:hypothetical protein
MMHGQTQIKYQENFVVPVQSEISTQLLEKFVVVPFHAQIILLLIN